MATDRVVDLNICLAMLQVRRTCALSLRFGSFGYSQRRNGESVAITQVQYNINSPAGVAASIASNPLNIGAGRLLIVRGSWGNNAITATGISDTAGNVFVSIPGANSGTTTQMQNFWYVPKSIANAANTITVTLSGNSGSRFLDVYEYDGTDTGAPLDQSSTAAGSVSQPVSPAVTTTYPSEVIIGWYVSNQGSATYTVNPGTGYTQDFPAVGVASSIAAEHEFVSAIGSFSAGFTIGDTTTLNWNCAITTFKASERHQTRHLQQIWGRF
jgi:hypothetical protein